MFKLPPQFGGSFLVSHTKGPYCMRSRLSSFGASSNSGSIFIPRLKLRAASFSFIFFRDLFPNLRYLNLSLSFFMANWPTVVMLALYKQLAAQTLNSFSYTFILNNFLKIGKEPV